MAIQKCANGHLYDTNQYPTCPYCGGTGNRVTPPQPYPVMQQQPYQELSQEKTGNRKAVASLICGILSLVLLVFGKDNRENRGLGFDSRYFLIILLGIEAIILSSSAKKDGIVNGNTTAGKIMGIISVSITEIFYFILFLPIY